MNDLVSAYRVITKNNTLNFKDDGTTITNLIQSGEFLLIDVSTGEKVETSIATNTGLREVSDESNLKKEEAKYEASMKKIDMKDRRYDQDLSALEAERNAVKQEMETLQTVAKDNVDRTFKIFS